MARAVLGVSIVEESVLKVAKNKRRKPRLMKVLKIIKIVDVAKLQYPEGDERNKYQWRGGGRMKRMNTN